VFAVLGKSLLLPKDVATIRWPDLPLTLTLHTLPAYCNTKIPTIQYDTAVVGHTTLALCHIDIDSPYPSLRIQ
jgi:hypothetical protein